MAVVFKSYRKESRSNYGVSVEEAHLLTHEQLNLGAQLRIADAMESIAKNHVQLQRDYDYMKQSRDNWHAEYEKLQRSNRALKGIITKLKKKLNQ